MNSLNGLEEWEELNLAYSSRPRMAKITAATHPLNLHVSILNKPGYEWDAENKELKKEKVK